MNSGVGRDWYGWVSDILCALGSRPFFCRYQCPGIEGGLFFFFYCKLYLVVESIEVVQKFCRFFLAIEPDEESAIYIYEPAYRFVCRLFY